MFTLLRAYMATLPDFLFIFSVAKLPSEGCGIMTCLCSWIEDPAECGRITVEKVAVYFGGGGGLVQYGNMCIYSVCHAMCVLVRAFRVCVGKVWDPTG